MNSEKISLFLAINPAFFILCGLLNGILSFLYLSFSAAILLTVFSASILYFLPDANRAVRNIAKFAVFSVFGWCAARNASIPSSSSFIRTLPADSCYAEIKVRISDTSVPSNKAAWMRKPRKVRAEILEIRTLRDTSLQPCSGSVLLGFSAHNDVPAYGTTLFLTGYFTDPPGPVFDGDFDYRRFLLSQGIRKIFYAADMRVIPATPPLHVRLFRNILVMRDLLLSSLTSGMETENRRMLGAIMFGYRQGLDYTDRRNFRRSGLINLFAVSGLHVGILAVTLLLVLSWVPFRTRYLILPGFLFLYVLSTGMQVSALRAFLMIGMWSVMKALMHRISPLNIVFLAASMILAMIPFSVYSAGFQFSFVISGFLVLSWRAFSRWSFLINEHALWIPAGADTIRNVFLRKLRLKLFNAAAVSLTAWLSGAALLLLHRSFFIPGAVFANLLMIPAVWGLFVLTALNILILPLHFLFSLNSVLDIMINFIRFIADSGASACGGLSLPSASVWTVIAFLCFLALFISTESRRIFFGTAFALALTLSYWFFSPVFRGGEAVVFHGGESSEPAAVFIPSAGLHGASVLNPGPPRRSAAILAYLKMRGVNSVDTLLFSENRRECTEGASALLSGINVRHVIVMPEYRRSSYTVSALKNGWKSRAFFTVCRSALNGHAPVKYQTSGLFFSRASDRKYFLRISQPEWSFTFSGAEVNPGVRRIKYYSEQTNHSHRLVNSSALTLFRLK